VSEAPQTEISTPDDRFKVLSLGSVTFDLPNSFPTVNLTEEDEPWRPLSIPVALAEAISITQAMADEYAPRPNTHDLFAGFLREMKADVIATRLLRVENGIFYAEIDVMTPKGRIQIPCRPSDGIALAVRQAVPAPILCTEEVLLSQN
jgi:bifunctional DNase/RNase